MGYSSGLVLPKMSKGIRWLKIVLRWLIWAGLLLVFARGVFSIVMPPSDNTKQVAAVPAAVEPDGLRAFPILFASEYLTWNAHNSSERVARIKPYLAANLDEQGGWSIGEDGQSQLVAGAWVYGVQNVNKDYWQVTVIAKVRLVPQGEGISSQKKSAVQKPLPVGEEDRTLLMTVPITKSGKGWVVYDYPSFLPLPPQEGSPEPLYTGQELSDEGERVQKLLTGFFKAYTSQDEITYFLLPGASIPGRLKNMNLEGVEEVTLIKNNADVLAMAEVMLEDPYTGANFLTGFTFKLVEKDGRWYIKEIME